MLAGNVLPADARGAAAELAAQEEMRERLQRTGEEPCGLRGVGTRTVISSVAVAKGVFRGVGEIVGVPRPPGDAPNVSRADLVYPVGTMHLVSMTVGASSSVDPHSCLFRATTQEQAHIEGGTGLFANAAGTFTGSVSPQGLLPRNPDGSCAVGQPLLHEVDMVEFSGTLSF